ncbi:hypothetical protein B0A50_03543 [Salinomyces thailandicus]|uniref:tRNA-splicing endonuclease subunit Sen2 n=1 Tax=Salinomyces thailandicus TaxID=706561 RepID=A0A4U0U3C7_9PEZI|nr:hypothetical protein B0A50_03543 [Salinomyces thailandica]
MANGHTTPKPGAQDNAPATTPKPGEQKKSRPRKRGPNYSQIHAKPLPLQIHPLPAFHPSHPLSLLHLCYVYLTQLISPPSSHPDTLYTGYYSPETRSVHVTDSKSIRALWEMGFFGKGNLSRSEPSWLEREKARVLAERAKRRGGGVGGGTAEEATMARREERRLFKLERARAERERIERQRAVEEGRMSVEEFERLEAGDAAPSSDQTPAEFTDDVQKSPQQTTHPEPRVPDADLINPTTAEPDKPALPGVTVTAPCGTVVPPEVPEIEEPEPEPNIPNQEHLQLTLEEAFFLSASLGILHIHNPGPPNPIALTPSTLLHTFTQTPLSPTAALEPDNPFLLTYTTYHHFRTLNWVVRPGTKFSCDYLLYAHGPVFSHAEFAVIILPAYTDPYWRTPEGLLKRRGVKAGESEGRDWWWLHCVNRVQSQVRKSLVLCYVDVPAPEVLRKAMAEEGWKGVLRRYKVREFVVRRWLANRSRD